MLITALTALGLSGVIVLGSSYALMQAIFASSEQETAEEDEPQD
jgi:hypothetical protein